MLGVFEYEISKLLVKYLSAILKLIEKIKMLTPNTHETRESGESLNRHLIAYK